MKKLYSLLLLVVTSFSFGQTIYSENMGTPAATTLIPAYITGTAPATFQNTTPIVYSGTADVRSSLATGAYTGASQGGNVFITNAAGKYFQIDGINTSAYTAANLQMSFGYNTSSTTAVQLIVEQSTDAGATWTPITFTPSASGWTLVTVTAGQIPSSSTLSLRFSQPATPSVQFRIDDVKVFNFNAACSLVLGTASGACDAVTFGTDTYTATIPYTGGGSGSYTLIASSGTVGGDNPATVAAGNITVSGIAEGSNLTLDIVSGVCTYQALLTSPECKPVNALPYSESFNYAAGSVLGSSQMWANVNTGDNVVAVAGNLSYTGLTSSGNSVTLGADGKECHTPFTATTSAEGNLFASFLINVTDYANVTADGNQDYFVVLTDGVASNFKGRLFIKKAGTQYQLGLTSGTSTTNYDATLFNVGDVVMVVLGYDFAGNTLKAWFNPVLSSFTAASTPNLTDTPASAITTLGGFLLRQGGLTTNPTITVDELRIGTTTADLLSVKNNSISGLSVYPNPVKNGVFYINSDANAVRAVTVFDIVGKQVLNTTTSNGTVNVSSLNAGIYMVKITEEGKTATKKLVIE